MSDEKNISAYGYQLEFGNKSALLISDMQNAYTDPTYERGMNQNSQIIIINKMISIFRDKNLPIFFSIIAFDDNQLKNNLWVKKIKGLKDLQNKSTLIEINPKLNYIKDSDILIVKQYPSAFFQTRLLDELKFHSIDTLIICGCTTSGCIRISAIDCLQNGIRPIIISDAVSDRWPSSQKQALFELNAKYADVISSIELFHILNKLRRYE